MKRGHRISPAAAVAWTLAAVAAFIIYRPDRALPFDTVDFSEFLPILQSYASFWERTAALIDYYAGQGRANLLPYVLLSAKWEVFEWWSPGWQWSRYAVMVAVTILAFHLLRRLGASALGAFGGATLFLVAPAATSGWIRLTSAEPLGTFLVLALCLVILPARRLSGSRARWVVVALLTIGIVFTKEMLAAAMALPAGLLLLTDEDGHLRTPRWSRHVAHLVILVALIGVLCIGPMLVVAQTAPSDSYASLYGMSMRPITSTLTTWMSTFVPVDPNYGFPGVAMRIANLGLVASLVIGWYLHLRESGRENRWLLGFALLLPLIGAVVYAPWPAYQTFYAIPFLFGASVLIAFALTGVERAGRGWVRVAAFGWWGLLLLVAFVDAHRHAGLAGASQLATYQLVQRISTMPHVDSVHVATGFQAPQRWQGAAKTLSRYARALNLSWPPSRDVPCADGDGAPPVDRQGSIVVVYRDALCPHLGNAEPIVQRYSRFSLRRLQIVLDSVRIDVGVPSSSR